MLRRQGAIVVEIIVSGAQTGADQGGLEAAVTLGLTPDGLAPFGYRTQAGRLTPEQIKRWNVKQHPSPNYPPRTEDNVRRSDVTIWFGKVSSPGYKCTRAAATRHSKPMHDNPPIVLLRALLKQYRIVNIAGNREESVPGLFRMVHDKIVEAAR